MSSAYLGNPILPPLDAATSFFFEMPVAAAIVSMLWVNRSPSRSSSLSVIRASGSIIRSTAAAALISLRMSYSPGPIVLDSGSFAAASSHASTDATTPSSLRVRPISVSVWPSSTFASTGSVPSPT